MSGHLLPFCFVWVSFTRFITAGASIDPYWPPKVHNKTPCTRHSALILRFWLKCPINLDSVGWKPLLLAASSNFGCFVKFGRVTAGITFVFLLCSILAEFWLRSVGLPSGTSAGPYGAPERPKTRFQPLDHDSGGIWDHRIFDHFGSLFAPYTPGYPPFGPMWGLKLR